MTHDSMKVLHLIHSGEVGGGPKVVLDLASRLPGKHTVASGADGPLLTDAAQRGISTQVLRFSGEYSFTLSVPFLARYFRRFDLVHLHGQFAAFYGSIAAATSRSSAVVYTAHFPSFVTDSTWKNARRNHIAELVPCRISNTVVACSETSRHEYLDRRLVVEDRIRTIYNGVALQDPSQAAALTRQQLNLSPADIILLAMGRFTDQKGFDILLDAMPLLLQQVPTVKLLLVGDGERRSSLERQSRRLGIEEAVRFTGFRRDTANLLDVACVVTVPSRYDIFPLVPLEAMMAGKGVVASDLPALREAIEGGVTGLLVPPEPQAFAHALGSLIQDQPGRQEMGAQARERARKRFTVERMASEYSELYEDLGSSRR